jgi:hypothetical protein
MAETETNTPERRGAQPADEVTEKRWQLIHQCLYRCTTCRDSIWK